LNENIYEVPLNSSEYGSWQLGDTSAKIDRLEEKIQKAKRKRKRLIKKGGKRSKKAIRKCNRTIRKQKKEIRKLKKVSHHIISLEEQLQLTNNLLRSLLFQQPRVYTDNCIDGRQSPKNILLQSNPQYLPKGE